MGWKQRSEIIIDHTGRRGSFLYQAISRLLSAFLAALERILFPGERRQAHLVEDSIDTGGIELRMKEQVLDIALAKSILSLTNGTPPRYVDLSDELTLASCAISLACRQEGGDHYFICPVEENGSGKGARTLFSLKDQSGHQVGCILRSILTDLLHRAIIKSRPAADLEDGITLLNAKICEHAIFTDRDFVTATNGEIDHETLTLRYVLCGHSNFLVISGDKVVSLPEEGSNGKNLPIGALRNASYSAGLFRLNHGDKIILYTDGLTQTDRSSARSPNGRSFVRLDIKAIVREIVDRDKTLPVLDIMQNLIVRVSEMSRKAIDPSGANETADDITLLGMEIESKKDYLKETWKAGDLQELQNRIDSFFRRHESEWIRRGYDNPSRLRYALSEAVLNAWRHGNECDPNKEIGIRYRYGSDFLLEVTDEGAGFDRTAIPDPRYGESLYKSGGRGILLIKRCTTSVGWHEKGNRLVMTFDRCSQPGYLSMDTVEEYIGL